MSKTLKRKADQFRLPDDEVTKKRLKKIFSRTDMVGFDTENFFVGYSGELMTAYGKCNSEDCKEFVIGDGKRIHLDKGR